MSAKGFLVGEELHVRANIYLYGSFANAELAHLIESEINQMWNQPLVVVPVEENYFKPKFLVRVSLFLEGTNIPEFISNNNSLENNFIRIEEKNIVERSMMGHGLGQNSGHWLITDELGKSTTAAHEFGHALGLPHPARLDYRGYGFPPLMAPRGTLVDREFQWNPQAETGAYGGTMRPIYRRVYQEEVLDVFRRAMRIGADEFAIGELSNVYFDQIGRQEIIR